MKKVAYFFTFFWLLISVDRGFALEFPKKSIRLGNKSFIVEIADTDSRRLQGLMNRHFLPENQGMLFVFPSAQILRFWMKNTYIPLSIGFFDQQQRLLEVLEMKEVRSVMSTHIPQYASHRPALYALEMNQGWFKKNNILPGAKFEWEE